MSKLSGLSSVLAAAASYLVVGTVALGLAGPAHAASEEDLARPHGSFLSVTAPSADPAPVYRLAQRPALILASEEDAAVPHGAFTSAMTAPQSDIRLADAAANVAQDGEIVSADRYEVVLSSIVSHGLE